MNDEPPFADSDLDASLSELDEVLGTAPTPPRSARPGAMRERMLQRVAQSVAAHAGLINVRVKDGLWRQLKRGIRVKPLWSGPAGNSVLIELAPGASLPTHRHQFTEEGIVLRGELRMGELVLGPGDYHVSPAGSRHEPIESRSGALAYLRGTSLGLPGGAIREVLGGLLPGRGPAWSTVYLRDASWTEIAPGVFRSQLWTDGIIASCYCRLEPGARFMAHRHPVDEECIMLQGEVFLGDILLREGDYQCAPAGSRHGEVFSDVGGLLYVRGAASLLPDTDE